MRSETIFFLGLACWLLGAIVTIPRLWGKTVTMHGLWLYLTLAGIFTAFRTGLYFYLKLIVPHYEHTWFERGLSLFLYPEFEILDRVIFLLMPESLFPGYYPVIYPTFWALLVSILFLGSLIWLYPLLGMSAREKEGAINLP